MEIKKICVIGAGTMGAGIAAQVANAGLEVLLLDIAGNNDDRNSVAERGLERIARSDPPLLLEPDNIEHISIGNIEDDLVSISECDWVVEAIVERLDIKRGLYRDMMAHLKTGAMVSSNTSTIPISLLMEGMDDALRRRFCITHFFNPVRYMRLLELVSGEETDAEIIECLAEFCDKELGKGIVKCGDTPGFLGNRVGVFAMQAAIHEAGALGINIEEADALFGRPMGIPKTGAFGLYDLIGIDLMADVVRSLRAILPQDDAFHAIGDENPLINSLVERGYTGNKGKGGFYRTHENNQQAMNLQTGQWRDSIHVEAYNDGLSELVRRDDKAGEFCWRVLARILTYSASILPQVTQTPQDIDDAMKLGYNWVQGPFEMLDEIGVAWFVERLEKNLMPVPPFLQACQGESIYKVEDGQLRVRHWDGVYRNISLPQGVVRFHMMRRELSSVRENESASLFYLDDGVRLVEFHTKANALDADCMQIISQAADDPGVGIIIHNDAQHFSAGVNLERFLELIKAKDWSGIDGFLNGFQSAVTKLLYCQAPVIGAPSGLAIGGGYEVLAHCDKIVAHANSVMGLVEPVVGLVPGGGGVKETYWRWFQRTGDWEKAAWKCFNQIGFGQTGSSPALAEKLCYFNWERDGQVINRDRLIGEARAALFQMKDSYQPRQAPEFCLAGGDVYAAMAQFLENGKQIGKFFPHDVIVGKAIAAIVTGGENAQRNQASEQDMFDSERKNFITLAKTPQTLARITSMLGGQGVVRN